MERGKKKKVKDAVGTELLRCLLKMSHLFKGKLIDFEIDTQLFKCLVYVRFQSFFVLNKKADTGMGVLS